MATKKTASKKTEAPAEAPADPAPPAEAEKIEPVEIAANEPYPTGSPPDPAEEFKKIHGYDKPKE